MKSLQHVFGVSGKKVCQADSQADKFYVNAPMYRSNDLIKAIENTGIFEARVRIIQVLRQDTGK